MSAHTPGPWKAPRLWDKTGLSTNAVTQDCQPGGVWKADTAVICTLPPDPLNRPNANLIAAAPEMLAALRECLESEERRRRDLKDGSPASSYSDARLARIRAAIAKAEGR